ncbi:DUF1707 SHOCT-like domain-containing protein [Kribbella sp. GL6]|uniref:DUF1707 SHOCT-like domain-containing protein n=1 Tax=Kribbella sp. GL6 TaxID=3419765 RepID=UPI003D06876A
MTSEDRSPAIGDVDRNAAVERVQAAYTGGYLTHGEMEQQLDEVLSARTRFDLELAVAALPALPAGSTSTINAASGRIVRRGGWRLPRYLKVVSMYGRVRLDLSQAQFEDGAVDIDLNVMHGGVKITLPRNAVVDFDSVHTEWKDTRYKPARNPAADGPRVRLTGVLGFGRLKIRHARR